MADLARIARPWLASLGRPTRLHAIQTPYLGLGSRGISTTACRAAKRDRYPKDKASAREARRKDQMVQASATASFLLPYTVVPPPVWRFPLSPIKFGQMVWLLGKNRLVSLGSLLGIYFISMRTKGFGWPLFRARKRACVPAARALHVQMSEAVSDGDKDTLRRICAPELFQTLAGAIDARPRDSYTEWRLLRYDNKLRYPRLADFRVTYQPLPNGRDMKLVKQAVVSISSVQRLTRYDEYGNKVPGGERERRMLEHIVLQAGVHDKTFEHEPWQIWGTLPEMSFETIRDDTAMYQDAMANQARPNAR